MSKQETLQADSYLSIAGICEGAYKESGSRFLSIAYPCTSPQQAEELIKSLKKKYHDATHHCYAYRIGLKGDIFRINDDGEPSSTAGRPIYGEILSHNLSDVMIVVVRWFGGIKLGVPGLIKAYKTAAADAIAHAGIITKTATRLLKVTFEYPVTDKVLRELRKAGAEPHKKEFGETCFVEVNVKLSGSESVARNLEKIEGVSAVFAKSDPDI